MNLRGGPKWPPFSFTNQTPDKLSDRLTARSAQLTVKALGRKL